MFEQKYSIIGVMSGTSLDGVDLAHIHFTIINGKWDYTILECETISYDDHWLNLLKTAVDFSAEKLVQLNKDRPSRKGYATHPHPTRGNRSTYVEPSSSSLHPRGVFVDLGCGRGKMVAAACSLPHISAHFSKCLGVEVLPQRLRAASLFLERFE